MKQFLYIVCTTEIYANFSIELLDQDFGNIENQVKPIIDNPVKSYK